MQIPPEPEHRASVQHLGTMRADLLLLCSCVLIGYGDTFQIANFLSSFSGEAAHQRQLGPPYPDSSYPAQLTERQAGLGGDQIAERQSIVVGSITTIFVVFMISLITSIVTNIMFSIESIIPNNGGSKSQNTYQLKSKICRRGALGVVL